ncbi:hypothetical protein PCANC_23479 [Puccinia coronata f. sp. avenae]|uniref:Uncharacterized protein n=1 Tax=Puccinia coronata f. sp. avenae TaxID=200324 RepID=A0A2N5V649_9BASI|nr:hypothetical protein PCANC_23479 [Puccinia coronata f. sp. avenae]PLW45458.1 hypothetical protein PCASD_05956 [Puccinia coronata f. sp. avenae]
MAQTHFLALPNKDLISSFSFNYYGTRLAVSSLDHHIYILSSDPESGKWPEDHSQEPLTSQPNPEPSPGPHPIHNRKNPSIQAWTAHEGPVIKVIWSDPIHGEILASAGTDGTVRIWEEDTRRIDYPSGNETTGNKSNPAGKQSAALSPGGWYQQTILADSNRTIRDIGFSPSETSLRLASISSDHHLRIYECLETNSFSSDNWNLIINIDMSVLPSYPTTTSDHLNPNLAPNNTGPSSSAVTGGTTTTTTTTTTTGFQQHSHSPFTSVRGFDPSASLNTVKNNNNPSTAGTNFNLINPLSGLRSSTITPTHPASSSAFNPPATSSERSNLESFGGWSLSWCPESYWGNILAASAGSSGLIRLFKFTSHAQWENFGILNPLNFSNPNSAIHDPTLPPSSHLNHTNHSIRHAPTANASSTIAAAATNTNTTATNSTAAAGTTPAAAAGSSSSSSSSAAHISPVSSLAWAPPCGRDYHLIAAGHRDGRARIWKLVVPNDAASDWKLELNTELEDHVSLSSSSSTTPHPTNHHPIPPASKSHDGPAPAAGGGVGKCEWNISGTVLSTSGSDGKIRIWKMGYTSRWVNTAEINCVDHSNSNDPHSDTGHDTPGHLQPTPNTGEAIIVG